MVQLSFGSGSPIGDVIGLGDVDGPGESDARLVGLADGLEACGLLQPTIASNSRIAPAGFRTTTA